MFDFKLHLFHCKQYYNTTVQTNGTFHGNTARWDLI